MPKEPDEPIDNSEDLSNAEQLNSFYMSILQSVHDELADEEHTSRSKVARLRKILHQLKDPKDEPTDDQALINLKKRFDDGN